MCWRFIFIQQPCSWTPYQRVYVTMRFLSEGQTLHSNFKQHGINNCYSVFLPGFYFPDATVCSSKNTHGEVFIFSSSLPTGRALVTKEWLGGISTAHSSLELSCPYRNAEYSAHTAVTFTPQTKGQITRGVYVSGNHVQCPL